MNPLNIAMVGVCLLGLMQPSAAMAAKADGKKARLIAKYDKNKNGVIDGEEMDALRKDFAADKAGDLKTYDTNGDGKLSDEEIKAIKPGAGKKVKAKSQKDSATGEKKDGPKKEKSQDGKAKQGGSGAQDKPKTPESPPQAEKNGASE
jgi:hypothetical protein